VQEMNPTSLSLDNYTMKTKELHTKARIWREFTHCCQKHGVFDDGVDWDLQLSQIPQHQGHASALSKASLLQTGRRKIPRTQSLPFIAVSALSPCALSPDRVWVGVCSQS
jgi:hypothetical protein